MTSIIFYTASPFRRVGYKDITQTCQMPECNIKPHRILFNKKYKGAQTQVLLIFYRSFKIVRVDSFDHTLFRRQLGVQISFLDKLHCCRQGERTNSIKLYAKSFIGLQDEVRGVAYHLGFLFLLPLNLNKNKKNLSTLYPAYSRQC